VSAVVVTISFFFVWSFAFSFVRRSSFVVRRGRRSAVVGAVGWRASLLLLGLFGGLANAAASAVLAVLVCVSFRFGF